MTGYTILTGRLACSAEHHFEVRRIFRRKSDVGQSHRSQPGRKGVGGGTPGCVQGIRELGEARFTDSFKQIGLVSKVAVSSHAGHAYPGSEFPQSEGANPFLLN